MRWDRRFADVQSHRASRGDHLQIEIKAVAQSLKGDPLQRSTTIHHVTAMVIGKGESKSLVFEGREDAIGAIFIKWHAALDRGARGDARSLKDVEILLLKRFDEFG